MNENLTTKMQIDLPMDFDIKLDALMSELKANGVKTSKAKQVVKFAQIGFNVETKNNEL